MKKNILTNLIIGFMVIGFMIIGLTGCMFDTSNKTNLNDNSNVEETESITVEKYYEDDESINLLLNKYNQMFDPDITSSMLTKKHIGGRDRDDVVIVSNDKLEIILYGSKGYNGKYSMSVYIGYIPKVSATNDDYKEQFIRYVKLFDRTLTDEEIINYWNDMISEYRSSYEINEIDITPNIGIDNGKVSYFKMTAKIEL